ncbi:MAG: glycosyltransferase family 4 protein [Nitrososphaerota archaeon]|nr:glycosyltransferase family 4 protein [Candidatus Bathyarchaeota archaeon]MDW8048705.1 glycosyltransferase family 4 protein [Nitrososphaerota archaeon]
MKIGVLTSGFHPDRLDARNRSVWEINSRLKKRGHEVTIITDTYVPSYERLGVKVYGLASKSSFGFFSDAQNIVRNLNLDLCHFYGSLSGAILFSHFFHDFSGTAIVGIYDNPLTINDMFNLTTQDLCWSSLSTLHSLLNSAIPSYLVSIHLRKIEKIILLGDDKRVDSKLLTKKTTIVPHGVDYYKFAQYNLKYAESLKAHMGFCKNDKIVLYLGHCSPSRGLDDLIASFHIIKKETPKAKLLLVVTPTSYLGYIQKIIRKYNLTDRVKIVARWVYNPEHYFWLSDVVVVPYRFKDSLRIPFVLLEAMASGKPIVATDVACSSFSFKNEVDGLVVKAGRRDDLASAILKFLLDDSLAKICGFNAQTKVKSLDWEVVVEKIENIYREVTNKNVEKRKNC